MKQYSVQRTPSRSSHWPGHGHYPLLIVTLLFLLVGSVVLSQKGTASDLASTQDSQDTESPWWQDLNIVSGGNIAPEMDRLIDVVGLGSRAETKTWQQNTQRQIAQIHAKGGRYVGEISTFDATYQTYMERPELATAATIDIYGKPIIVWWESTPEEPLWWGNTNHPVWQEFLLEQAKALVDAGADGVYIDEIEGSAAIWSGGSFGEPDMSMFRAYLAESYTQEELLYLFGINNINTFDYGRYIHSLGLADTWVNARWRVPLYDDFLRFQRSAIVEFMTKLVNETKSYARATYGREVAFTANIFGLAPSLLIFADLLDYYMVEYPYMDYGYPPESQAITDYKLARALGNKPAVNLAHIATNADLLGRKSSSTLMTIYIAEAYASQGAMMVPYGIYAWTEETGPDQYYGDMSVLAPAYQFVKDNPLLYEELDSLAQVAVLYSFPTNYHRGEYRDSLRGLNYALLDGHVQYDIVAMGDDVWLTDTFSTASLAPHQLVFLPGAEYLSDAQVDLLLSYVAEGGTLVAWGDIGIYNEIGLPADRQELNALTMPGAHAYGDGWFITLTGDPGDTYRQTHDATVRQQLVSLVDEHADSVTTMSAERTLNVVTYERAGGSQMVTHLINYDYNIETDQVTPTGPFTLTLKLPEGFPEQDEIQVYLLSPQRPVPLLLDFAIGRGLLEIYHSGMEVYDVLIAMPRADARMLADEILDVLTQDIAQAVADGYDTSSLDDLMSQIDDANTAGNHLLARQLGQEALELIPILTRPRILFDEAHDERNTLSWERALTLVPDHPDWVHFGALTAALENDFVFQRNPSTPLSPEFLKDYDVLMLSAPEKTLHASELRAVIQFVADGGSLLILGDCGFDNESVETLVRQSGIAFDPHCIFTPAPEQIGDFPVTAFADHLATSGVPSMVTNWGGSLEVNEPAVALAFTDEDAWRDTNWNGIYDAGDLTGPFTIAAASLIGSGRMVVVADNSFQDSGFEYRSNALFMRSLLRWLTGYGMCGYPWDTDEDGVITYPAWDVDQDGVTDISDLLIIVPYFGKTIDIPTDPNPDVNRDGKVDLLDLILVCVHYGENYQGDIYVKVIPLEVQTVPEYGIFEAYIETNIQCGSPLSREAVDLKAHFLTPTGKEYVVPVFYDADIDQPAWKVRYTPVEVGQYSYYVVLGEIRKTEDQTFDCIPSMSFYVAPDGSDGWSGRLERPNAEGTDGPLASLAGARDAVRRLKDTFGELEAERQLEKPVTITIADGTYYLSETFMFTPEDSGTEQRPVIYQASPGAKPIFSGGRRITGFRPGENGIWTVEIPEVASGEWYFEQLWVNGRRATRARTPNGFYHYMAGKVDYGTDPNTGKQEDLSKRAFRVYPGDIKLWPNLSDITVVVYHLWEISRHRISSFAPETDTVIFTGPAEWPFMQWGSGQRYHVENFREALDEPGEWFLDRDGTLYYIPLPEENMAEAEVIAPAGVEQFIGFQGEPESGRLVENIALEGLTFCYSQYILPSEGHSDAQAEYSVPAVLMVDGGRNIVIEDCEISHIGSYGIWFRRGCSDCRVQSCYIRDMGAGGIRIGEGMIRERESERTGRIIIDNNIIHSGGRIFMGAIGVWIGQSGYNQITHNDIADFFYTGVSVGWQWGYGESLAVQNSIDFNHIHHLGWGVLSDMGGVYTLGPSEGTTVSNNLIHNIAGFRYGGCGIYFDEGSTDIVAEDNLVYRTTHGGFHQHYGRENIFRNNIIVFGRDQQIQRTRQDPHRSFTFERNIVYWREGNLIVGDLRGSNFAFDRNIYWREGGGDVRFAGMTLREWQRKGMDKNSLIVDPLFVDPGSYDFRLQDNSPAFRIAFKPFDYASSGVRGDPEWVRLAEGREFPEVEFAPVAEPVIARWPNTDVWTDPFDGEQLDTEWSFRDRPGGPSIAEVRDGLLRISNLGNWGHMERDKPMLEREVPVTAQDSLAISGLFSSEPSGAANAYYGIFIFGDDPLDFACLLFGGESSQPRKCLIGSMVQGAWYEWGHFQTDSDAPLHLMLEKVQDRFTGYYRAGEEEDWRRIDSSWYHSMTSAKVVGVGFLNNWSGQTVTLLVDSFSLVGEGVQPLAVDPGDEQ